MKFFTTTSPTPGATPYIRAHWRVKKLATICSYPATQKATMGNLRRHARRRQSICMRRISNLRRGTENRVGSYRQRTSRCSQLDKSSVATALLLSAASG